jgi:hypothetical protein
MFATSSAPERPANSSLLLVDAEGAPYRCSGSTCDPFQKCSVPIGGKYRIVGKLVPLPATPSAEVELERVSAKSRVLEVISIVAVD